MSNQKSRNSAYDFLKSIGLSAIILAHVNPPSSIMMIRSFDVPLMVMLSALLAKTSYDKHLDKNMQPFSYIIYRAKRLVFPTWIFLTFYFVTLIIGTRKLNSIQYYLESYALTQYGINYVWIILVYLYIAFLIPIFKRALFSSKSLLVITSIYIVYEICYHYQLGVQNKAIMTTFYSIIPYGTLAFLGYNYTCMKSRTKIAITIVFFTVFIALAIFYFVKSGTFQIVQIAKYPPRLYYISYGIACSFFVFILCEKHTLKIFELSLIRYISTHSIWIYLWHIFLLTVYDALHLPQIWIIKYLFVYIGALIIIIRVNKILDCFEKHYKLPIIKYLRG